MNLHLASTSLRQLLLPRRISGAVLSLAPSQAGDMVPGLNPTLPGPIIPRPWPRALSSGARSTSSGPLSASSLSVPTSSGSGWGRAWSSAAACHVRAGMKGAVCTAPVGLGTGLGHIVGNQPAATGQPGHASGLQRSGSRSAAPTTLNLSITSPSDGYLTAQRVARGRAEAARAVDAALMALCFAPAPPALGAAALAAVLAACQRRDTPGRLALPSVSLVSCTA